MKLNTQIEYLANKAKNAHDSADALRFSQAALNLANTGSTVACTPIYNIKDDAELSKTD